MNLSTQDRRVTAYKIETDSCRTCKGEFLQNGECSLNDLLRHGYRYHTGSKSQLCRSELNQLTTPTTSSSDSLGRCDDFTLASPSKLCWGLG